MKATFKHLIRLSLILLIVYAAYFSLYRAADNEIILLKDISNGQNIDIFSGQVNFIWRGVMPWKYAISRMSVDQSGMIAISVKIPLLSVLDDDIYVIKLHADIGYQIDKTNLPDISYLNSKEVIEDYITKKAAAVSRAALVNYIEPDYNKDRILNNEKEITEKIKNELIEKFNDSGIALKKVDFILPGYYPDNRTYIRGVANNEALLKFDFDNKKSEIELNKKLINDKKNNEIYYDKLLRISEIIKDNPDILKYIYIDKIGKDIKVIISSDKTGMPAMFGDSSDKTKPDIKEDLDNFINR